MASIAKNESGMMTGLFNDRASAERAYQTLSDRGYTSDNINVVMSEDTRKQQFAKEGQPTTELGTKAAEGAGIGGAVGGLLGALVGWGIPEECVKRYESSLKGGAILIGVRTRSEADAASIEQDWRANNAQDIYRPGSETRISSDTGNTVVGVYDEYADAQNAMQALAAAGFHRSNMRLEPESATQPAAPESGQSRGASGISGFFRSLFGADEQKERHEVYAESLRRGHHVLTVDAQDDDEVDRATEIMNRFNPVDIDERASYWKQQGWSGYDASAPRLSPDEIEAERRSYAQARSTGTGQQSTIPVIEEELKVGKRQVQRGGVRVFQRIRETPVRETVELREEHVKVERHAVDKPATEADLAAFKEGTIEVRETAEEAVVSKTAHVVEEVVVGKEEIQRTEEISDTVRRTDVEVEQLGATRTTADDDDFRRHWQAAYGTSGGRYEDYDAAYRYGSIMAGSGRYKNYQWTDVEPQLRSDWESQHPESTWDKVKDAVRYGAERVTGRQH